jgi:hypothetical protein
VSRRRRGAAARAIAIESLDWKYGACGPPTSGLRPSEPEPAQTVEDAGDHVGDERSTSVSSMRSRNVPP